MKDFEYEIKVKCLENVYSGNYENPQLLMKENSYYKIYTNDFIDYKVKSDVGLIDLVNEDFGNIQFYEADEKTIIDGIKNAPKADRPAFKQLQNDTFLDRLYELSAKESARYINLKNLNVEYVFTKDDKFEFPRKDMNDDNFADIDVFYKNRKIGEAQIYVLDFNPKDDSFEGNFIYTGQYMSNSWTTVTKGVMAEQIGMDIHETGKNKTYVYLSPDLRYLVEFINEKYDVSMENKRRIGEGIQAFGSPTVPVCKKCKSIEETVEFICEDKYFIREHVHEEPKKSSKIPKIKELEN